jgi:two-component system, cell cycle sensor histidine kinase and response regulator CckA
MRFAPRPTAQAPIAPARRAPASVLVVDDDQMMRTLVARTLTGAGYKVWTAASAGQARQLLPQLDRRLDILLTDVAMPGGLGPEVVAEVRVAYPHARLVYMSSYSPERLKSHGVDLRGAGFLAKPFMPAELLSFLQELPKA